MARRSPERKGARSVEVAEGLVASSASGSLSPTRRVEVRPTMARELEWPLFEKAVEITASALRGSMGGADSQPASYAGDVFRAVWASLKEAAADLPERGKPGF